MKRLWHDASKFPSPGIPLLVKLQNGETIRAIRPDYVRTYNHNPEYRSFDMNNELINGVTQWSIL